MDLEEKFPPRLDSDWLMRILEEGSERSERFRLSEEMKNEDLPLQEIDYSFGKACSQIAQYLEQGRVRRDAYLVGSPIDVQCEIAHALPPSASEASKRPVTK